MRNTFGRVFPDVFWPAAVARPPGLCQFRDLRLCHGQHLSAHRRCARADGRHDRRAGSGADRGAHRHAGGLDLCDAPAGTHRVQGVAAGRNPAHSAALRPCGAGARSAGAVRPAFADRRGHWLRRDHRQHRGGPDRASGRLPDHEPRACVLEHRLLCSGAVWRADGGLGDQSATATGAERAAGCGGERAVPVGLPPRPAPTGCRSRCRAAFCGTDGGHHGDRGGDDPGHAAGGCQHGLVSHLHARHLCRRSFSGRNRGGLLCRLAGDDALFRGRLRRPPFAGRGGAGPAAGPAGRLSGGDAVAVPLSVAGRICRDGHGDERDLSAGDVGGGATA